MSCKKAISLLRATVCCVLCACLFFALLPSRLSAAAEESLGSLTDQKASLSEREKELQAKREQASQSLKEQETQKELLREQIGVKSQQIAVNQQMVGALQEQIDQRTADIENAEVRIGVLKQQIGEQSRALRARLRAVSKGSSLFFSLSFLLDSSSYTDYLLGSKLMERISERDQQMMDLLESNLRDVRQTEDVLEEDRVALKERHTQAQSLQEETEADKKALQALYAEADHLAQRFSGEMAGYDDDIAELQAQQAAMQSKIDGIMEQLAAEEEAHRQEQQQQEEQTPPPEEENNGGDNPQGDNPGNGESNEGDPENGGNGENNEGDPEDGESGGDDAENNGGSGYTPPTFQSGSMMWPAPTCKVITSSFKSRWGRQHYGVDIALYGDAEGEPIVAAADGTVVYVNKYDTWGGGYGLHMMIDHGYDASGRRILTLYGHASEIIAYEGQEVSAGDRIGSIGNTGNSFGAHLHFEVREDGTAVDPVANGYLSTVGIDVLG